MGFPPNHPPKKKKKQKTQQEREGRAPADNSSQTGQNQVSQEGGGWLKIKTTVCSMYYCIFSVAGFSQSAAQQQQTGTLLPPQAIQQLYLHPLLSLLSAHMEKRQLSSILVHVQFIYPPTFIHLCFLFCWPPI